MRKGSLAKIIIKIITNKQEEDKPTNTRDAPNKERRRIPPVILREKKEGTEFLKMLKEKKIVVTKITLLVCTLTS